MNFNKDNIEITSIHIIKKDKDGNIIKEESYDKQ